MSRCLMPLIVAQKAIKVSKARRVFLDLSARKDLAVRRVSRAPMERKAQKDRKGHKALSARKDRRAFKVRLDLPDRKVRLDPLARRVRLARLVRKVQEVNREKLARSVR